MLAMNAGLASPLLLLRVVDMGRAAPAEKPIMPMRSGSTCHFFALVRASAKAALASAICGASRAAISAGDGRVAGREPAPEPAPAPAPAPARAPGGGPPMGVRANSARSAGVWLRRYLSTNA